MPDLADVHIDRAMTQVAIQYGNENYIADQVLPPLDVDNRSDKYFIFSREEFLTGSPLDAQGKAVTLRRPGAEAGEITYDVDTDNYNCEEYAIAEPIPDELPRFADKPLDPDTRAVRHATERVMIDNERMVCNLVCKRANYATANKATLTTGGSGTSWASYTSVNSLPFTDIRNAKLAVLKGVAREPNMMMVSTDSALYLADHPETLKRYQYVSEDALTRSGLPRVVRGLEVIEAPQQLNSAAPGAAYNGGNLWTADDGTQMVLIFYRNPNPSIFDINFGYTFQAPDGTTGERGLTVVKWREPKRKANMVQPSFVRDYKVVAKNASAEYVGGYLLSSVTV